MKCCLWNEAAQEAIHFNCSNDYKNFPEKCATSDLLNSHALSPSDHFNVGTAVVPKNSCALPRFFC